MAEVYSRRFIAGRGGDSTWTYAVPAGRTAVVRFVAINVFAVVSTTYLRVAGQPVYQYTPPGPSRSTFEDVRYTAYGGELIEVVVVGSDTAFHVSGFEFAGQAQALSDPEAVPFPPHGETLPAP